MTDAPERIWIRQTSGWGELQRGVYQNAKMDGYEYIRADLARPMTVAEAAKVLMGEMERRQPAVQGYGDAVFSSVHDFDLVEAHVRALSQGGE